MRTRLVAFPAFVAMALTGHLAVADEGDTFDSLDRVRTLSCSFYRASERVVADIDAAWFPERPDVGLFLDRQDGGWDRAGLISTQRAGVRRPQLRRGPRTLHFILPLGHSYQLTTLSGCARWNHVSRECVLFSATHSWLFDPAVMRDPDLVWQRHAPAAYLGFCEPWTGQ